MPKAKPVSLHPLNFEQAIDLLIKTNPKQLTKVAPGKRKKRKR